MNLTEYKGWAKILIVATHICLMSFVIKFTWNVFATAFDLPVINYQHAVAFCVLLLAIDMLRGVFHYE